MPGTLRRALACAILALTLLPAAAMAKKAQPALTAGAAEADITGPVGTPMFAYTARSYIFSPDLDATQQRALQMIADPDTGLYAKTFEPSDGIHTRVLARAIVFKQGKTKYALAQADLGGLPYALVQEVGKRIAGTGITTDHLLLSATHTHSSIGNIWPADNSGYAYVGGDAFDPRTFEQTADGIAKAITAAASEKRMRPARVGVGTTQLTGASRNREHEVHLRNSDLGPDDQPIDPTVTVVRVDDDKGA